MGIDEVSERLGALKQGMEDLQAALRDHITEENAWQDEVDGKLDCLLAKEYERKGMLTQAKKTARIWGAVIGAVVVAGLEMIKHWVIGA